MSNYSDEDLEGKAVSLLQPRQIPLLEAATILRSLGLPATAKNILAFRENNPEYEAMDLDRNSDFWSFFNSVNCPEFGDTAERFIAACKRVEQSANTDRVWNLEGVVPAAVVKP